MRSFKDEHSLLIEWMKGQLEKVSGLPSDAKGLDGSERDLAEQAIHSEYRERVATLKMKYNVA